MIRPVNNDSNATRWLLAAAIALGALSACGGDDDPAPAASSGGTTNPPPVTPVTPPADAAALQSKLSAEYLPTAASMLAAIEGGAIMMLNPGTPLAPSIVAAPDTSAGSPANTWTFKGRYDGNGSGPEETSIDGRFTFSGNPADFSTGFTGGRGSASLQVDLLGLVQAYRGNVEFSLGMNEKQISGGGTLTDQISGTTTTWSIPASSPMGVKPADGSATALPSACAHSLNGAMQFSMTGGAGGTLSSQWNFAYGRSTVAVTGASYTDRNGQAVSLPDSEVDLGCGGTGTSINDWSGRFRVRWACFPQEFGEFSTTISIKGGTTVQMIDDGDTAAQAYDATQIGGSPRAVRGFFISGPTGNRYREDFNWVLSADKNSFTQSSRYEYFEGPQKGLGGVCAARATRIP